jgi:hypothetical protein
MNVILVRIALKIELNVLTKRWYLPSSPHGVATQKTNIDIFTPVRTSDLT